MTQKNHSVNKSIHPRLHCLSVLSLCFWLAAGCSNYRFKDALRPEGKYDLQKLMADLRQKNGKPLEEFSCIPLAYVSETGFFEEGPPAEREEVRINHQSMQIASWGRYPQGFRLAEFQSYGPDFYSQARESHYTPAGEGYEYMEQNKIIFRLWQQTRSLVKTPQGTRDESRHEILFGILPVYHSVGYLPGEEARN